MRIAYNAPVVLNFTFLSLLIFTVTHTVIIGSQHLFITFPQFNFLNVLDYFRLFSHILGHQNIEHFVGNFTLILLLGPILEEKYGSEKLLYLILITAFTTAVLNTLLFKTGLMGASGIVFLFILLASFTTFKSGEIPLTFILVFIIFIGQEVVASFKNDNISQFAHVLGGMIGSIFGFSWNKK